VLPHRFKIWHHYRQRLASPMLAPAEKAHRIPVRGIATQVKSSQSAQGANLTFAKSTDGLPHNIVHRYRPTRSINHGIVGTTDCACIGLSVKSAVERVPVLRIASGAKRKGLHGRHWPVVGHVFDNRESRSTIRAVDEWISVPPVTAVKELPSTIVAGGDIWRHQLVLALLRLTLFDVKAVVGSDRQPFQREMIYAGQWRELPLEILQEGIEHLSAGLGFDVNAPRCVDDPTSDSMMNGESIDERPEPDTLHDPSYLHPDSLHSTSPPDAWATGATVPATPVNVNEQQGANTRVVLHMRVVLVFGAPTSV